MTMWVPNIEAASGPIYLAIADALEADILAGSLAQGDRLPPQRNFAYDRGIAVSTASRVYTELLRRGLVVGLLTASTATGQLVFLPVIAWTATEHSWRWDAGIVAALSLVVSALVSLLATWTLCPTSFSFEYWVRGNGWRMICAGAVRLIAVPS